MEEAVAGVITLEESSGGSDHFGRNGGAGSRRRRGCHVDGPRRRARRGRGRPFRTRPRGRRRGTRPRASAFSQGTPRPRSWTPRARRATPRRRSASRRRRPARRPRSRRKRARRIRAAASRPRTSSYERSSWRSSSPTRSGRRRTRVDEPSGTSKRRSRSASVKRTTRAATTDVASSSFVSRPAGQLRMKYRAANKWALASLALHAARSYGRPRLSADYARHVATDVCCQRLFGVVVLFIGAGSLPASGAVAYHELAALIAALACRMRGAPKLKLLAAAEGWLVDGEGRVDGPSGVFWLSRRPSRRRRTPRRTSFFCDFGRGAGRRQGRRALRVRGSRRGIFVTRRARDAAAEPAFVSAVLAVPRPRRNLSIGERRSPRLLILAARA